MTVAINHAEILRIVMTIAASYVITAVLTWALIPFLKKI
jgi:hypothetical protein